MTSSQMLKGGVLEGCVLALIGRGETYGYELVRTLAGCGLDGIAEGTLRYSCAWKRKVALPRPTVSPKWGHTASTTA